ncbi:MFS transporter [Streptomyces sp. DSM 41886]|uniref:MFS transporter n=1 Tax=Streptomyces johnsoniae TaxID=3075532 RepID=A0ABU2SCD9_9ACTN|nr:MFS transporter [Streptomyces sp. DSM 41886]MDT0446326.1 MFS transporter [Streptomyces sp. DSM 41886]
MLLPGQRRSGAGGPPADASLRQLRAALTVFFALDGFVFAGWVVRIPDIKDQTGASASALGVALLGVSAGGVVTMMLTGRLCQRFGNHPVTVAAGALLALSVVLPAHAHSAVVLGAVLLVFGTAFGAINVAGNSAAVDLVAALGRPVMPSFHAAFSLGGMLGAGLGGLVAGRLSAAWHLGLLAGFGLLIAAWAGRMLLAHPAPAPPRPAAREAGGPEDAKGAGARPMRGRVRRLVLVLGFIALCTTYGEGALADWSTLHLRESLEASPGVAAAGYSVFALAMTVGRLTGSAMLQRLGQARALIVGGATAAAGMLLASLAPTVGLALVGFVITGLGLANVFPITIGQAGALAGPRGVAAASTLGYGGMLMGPVAIGFLADWFSLAGALTTVAMLAAVAAVTAYALRGAVQAGT